MNRNKEQNSGSFTHYYEIKKFKIAIERSTFKEARLGYHIEINSDDYAEIIDLLPRIKQQLENLDKEAK